MQKKIVTLGLLVLMTFSLLAFKSVLPVKASPDPDVLVYGGSGPQNEVSIAVNPLKSSNVVVGFNDYSGGTWMASYSYSMDSGGTWTYGGILPRGTLAGVPYCDPWLAFDSSGYLYYVALSDTDNHEIFVCVAAPDAQGMVGPLGFGAPQIVDSGGRPNDKPAIAVDKTGGTYDGNIYVAWAHNTAGTVGSNGFRIFIRRGHRTTGTTTITWDPSQQVGPDTFTQGAQVAVGPSGQVYVAYQRQTSASLDTANAQLFSYSTDGGSTFTTGIFVSSVTPVNWDVSGPSGWARHTSFPTLGVSKSTGTIFIAWADRRNGDDDILLERSNDGGLTWSVPLRVNTDALSNSKDQWHPALTVDSLGKLYVIFYDRRDDPNNKLTMLYAARSTNQGDSFTNWAVSDAATNPDAFAGWASGSLGDYVGIDSTGDQVYMSWGDGRSGNIGPRDYNSDVYFEKYISELIFKPFPVLLVYHLPWWYIDYPPPLPAPLIMNLTILPVQGFNGTVTLSALGVPPKVDFSFSQRSGVPPFQSVFTIHYSESVSAGIYTITIVASFDELNATLPIQAVITRDAFILLDTTTANPGDTIALEGPGFNPNSSFDVFLDGELLKRDETNGEGIVSTQIEIPSDVPDGNHTVLVRDAQGITASASLITPIRETEGETEKPHLYLVGDVNGDKKVNILDMAIMAKAFDTQPGDERWNPVADLDKNGKINILDLALAAKNFGKSL